MQWLIDIMAELFVAKPSFQWGGPIKFLDLTKADFIQDHAWHDLDLSSNVPVGTTAVLVDITITNTAVDKEVEFKISTDVAGQLLNRCNTQVAGLQRKNALIIALDADRKCQYQVDTVGWTKITLHGIGWWK